MKSDNKSALASGVVILTAANLLVKVIGLVFKIPIQRLIGDEGMGYFNMAYNIYSWLYLVSTAGLPVALSVMISKATAQGKSADTKAIFRTSCTLFALIGTASALFMGIFARQIARSVEIDNAYLCAIAIAPTLFFICISSSVRGYFQGFGNMTVTAVSQVIESLGKVTFGLLLAVYSIKKGYPVYVTAAYAISGVTLGTLASMLFCLVSKCFFSPETDKEKSTCKYSDILKSLVIIALPITVSSSIMGLTNVIDTVISVGRLRDIGYASKAATEIYGNYTTLAVSLYNMPSVLIYPIACAIVPHLTKHLSQGKSGNTIISSCIKTCCVISMPCAVGLGVLSYPILCLLFPQDSAQLASAMLTMLSPAVFLYAMMAITNSVLQASGNERLPIISMITGIAVKLVSSYIFIGVDGIGRLGIPLGTCMCYLTIVIMNFIFVGNKTKVRVKLFKTFVLPLMCALICGLCAYIANKTLSSFTDQNLSVLLSITLAVLVYGVCVFKFKAVEKSDIEYLPKGEHICRMLGKLKQI